MCWWAYDNDHADDDDDDDDDDIGLQRVISRSIEYMIWQKHFISLLSQINVVVMQMIITTEQ